MKCKCNCMLCCVGAFKRELCDDEFCEKYGAVGDAEDFIEAIKALPSAQQWIPCGERLPEDDTEVFVYLFDNLSPYIAWICDGHWYTEEFEVERENEPVAWMPLPEPYKE